MAAIELRPELREQVEFAARREARTVDDLVNAAVEDYVQTQHRSAIARETSAFEAMHADLLTTHRGQWVAIYNGTLVDCDTDITPLYTRARKAYGRTPVLLTQVLDDPAPVLHLRTPSFGRKDD
ncbi:MAG: DUF5678 domain-containing protein [Chloroflexota bacterium]